MVDVRDLMRLEGRVSIVAGGARGMGRRSAETLAVAGGRVVLADLDKNTAEGAAAEMRALGLPVTATAAAVADEASVDSMVQATLEREGRRDILVNNAGIAIRRAAVDLALGDWDKVLSVNMTGSFLCARLAVRAMIAVGADGERSVDHGPIGWRPLSQCVLSGDQVRIVNMTRAPAVEWAPHSSERGRANLCAHRADRIHPQGPGACRPDRGDEGSSPSRRISRRRSHSS